MSFQSDTMFRDEARGLTVMVSMHRNGIAVIEPSDSGVLDFLEYNKDGFQAFDGAQLEVKRSCNRKSIVVLLMSELRDEFLSALEGALYILDYRPMPPSS